MYWWTSSPHCWLYQPSHNYLRPRVPLQYTRWSLRMSTLYHGLWVSLTRLFRNPKSLLQCSHRIHIRSCAYDIPKISWRSVLHCPKASRLPYRSFAIKSGGHNPNPGFSVVNGGVLMSMGKLANTTLSSDKTTAVFGSGAQWGEVVDALEPENLVVPRGWTGFLERSVWSYLRQCSQLWNRSWP